MTVELIDHMGDDLSIVNAARVSYGRRSTTLSMADEKLIGYLARYHHGTPFEMVQFTFRVRCPIGEQRDWVRHRIGSFNEISTRYVEMQPDFYVPPLENVRTQIGKPGHYQMAPVDAEKAGLTQLIMQESYERAYADYQRLLDFGIAKELAKFVLPLGLMTEFIWSVNLRSCFNFLSLRNHETALKEIQQDAQTVEYLVEALVPVAYQAWIDGGRLSI